MTKNKNLYKATEAIQTGNKPELLRRIYKSSHPSQEILNSSNNQQRNLKISKRFSEYQQLFHINRLYTFSTRYDLVLKVVPQQFSAVYQFNCLSLRQYLCSTGVGEGQTSGSRGVGDPQTSGSSESLYVVDLTGPKAPF